MFLRHFVPWPSVDIHKKIRRSSQGCGDLHIKNLLEPWRLATIYQRYTHARTHTHTYTTSWISRTVIVGAHKNFSREGQGLGDMASAGRESISGVWGRRIAPGPQGRAFGQRVSGPRPPSPLNLKALKHSHTYRRPKRQSKAVVSQFSSLPVASAPSRGKCALAHAYMGAHDYHGRLMARCHLKITAQLVLILLADCECSKCCDREGSFAKRQ